ncbi:hypothetical protein P7K49_014596 [Saguinus oedipus]|uniref:Uncharacterized protein n=1 Tax=Saguinus oedipus TaxID=9490 RepID=A0ABQ9V9I0_SAGOE|nr:hypothetical protein P7K49_014596 [Saguinus oedipus]
MVPCFDASKVKCSGPGPEWATTGEVGQFQVNCSSVSSAELTIEICSEAGLPAEVYIQDHGDGMHTTIYIPLCVRTYTVTIKLCPTSPASCRWSLHGHFQHPTGGPHIKARVPNPSGNLTETYVQDCSDGTYKVEYSPYEEGPCRGSGRPVGRSG